MEMSSKRAEELEQLMERVDPMSVRRRKTQPAGSKRKMPEQDTFRPPGGRWTPTPESIREANERHQALMRGAQETIRELDEALEAIAQQERDGGGGDAEQRQDDVHMD